MSSIRRTIVSATWVGIPAPSFAFGVASSYPLAALISGATEYTITSIGAALPSGVTINNTTRALVYDGVGAATSTANCRLRVTAGGAGADSSLFSTVIGAVSSPSTLPLSSGADVSYVGSFAPPPGAQGDGFYDDFGFALSFYRDNGAPTLFTQSGRGVGGRMGQFAIPNDSAMIQTSSKNWSVYTQYAQVLQPFREVTNNSMNNIDVTGEPCLLYGSLAINGQLLLAAANYYTAAPALRNVGKLSSTNLSTATFSGFRLLSGSALTNFTRPQAGMMCVIPPAWRSALGGDVMMGNGTGPLSVVGNSSWGFSIHVVDSATLSGYTGIFFDGTHQMSTHIGGEASVSNPVWHTASWIGGYFIPEGSRSLGVVYAHGAGNFCYGFGYESGPPDGGGTPYCGDEWNPDTKGPHAQLEGFGYQLQIAWYDLNDIVQVKNGTRQWWDMQPTSIYILPDYRANNPSGQINGMAWADFGYIKGVAYEPDRAPGRGRLYISPGAQSGRIEVFEVRSPT